MGDYGGDYSFATQVVVVRVRRRERCVLELFAKILNGRPRDNEWRRVLVLKFNVLLLGPLAYLGRVLAELLAGGAVLHSSITRGAVWTIVRLTFNGIMEIIVHKYLYIY